jgi:hypothetical protein
VFPVEEKEVFLMTLSLVTRCLVWLSCAAAFAAGFLLPVQF